ncbi:hypothetical protein HHK36_011508 [Tetracentron sinense]|uniref:Fungal lipase-type domain-containing protein n=1 Tax=Tetracentron sinense TaxID=13715 RepID=A0A834ZBW2_TETSI|nr:hypothetical protein HHK36_011508 [Tetracentron sinense]
MGNLRIEPFFDIKVQVRVVLACCTLHNFIITEDPDDSLEEDPDDCTEYQETNDGIEDEVMLSLETSDAWTQKRDELATLMLIYLFCMLDSKGNFAPSMGLLATVNAKNPSTTQFRSKSITEYDNLTIIIGNDQAHGGSALSGIDAENEDDNATSVGTFNIRDLGEEEENPNLSSAPTSRASSSRWDNEKKKRKKSRRESITDDIQVFSESLKCIADTIEGASSMIDMDKLFTELMKIPDFDKELVIEAAEYLSSDKKKVDMFFAMNEDYRKTCLRERAQVEQLLRYIVEEVPEDAEKSRTFKFPFIACEIFTCEVDIILKTVVEDEEFDELVVLLLGTQALSYHITGRVLQQGCHMPDVVENGSFYELHSTLQKERSTQVFILCDKPKDANLILISFRGTEPFDADDWSTDFDCSWYEIPKLGKVHMGFLEALGLGNRAEATTFQNHLQVGGYPLKDMKQYSEFSSSNGLDVTTHPSEGYESDTCFDTKCGDHSEGPSGKKKLLPDMVEMTAYYAVRIKLKSLLDEHKNAKFVVTGHSLGGALAILFLTVLLLHEEKEMMQRLMGVYTFGQPRVGNRQLGRFMEAHVNHPVPKYFRVVYCNDLVPRLPYDDRTFLYKHFGLYLYYNSCYIEQVSIHAFCVHVARKSYDRTEKVEEEPNRNYFGILYLIPEYLNSAWELVRSLTMGYTHGPEYKVLQQGKGSSVGLNRDTFDEMFEVAVQAVTMNYYPPCSRPDLVLGLSLHSDGSAITV